MSRSAAAVLPSSKAIRTAPRLEFLSKTGDTDVAWATGLEIVFTFGKTSPESDQPQVGGKNRKPIHRCKPFDAARCWCPWFGVDKNRRLRIWSRLPDDRPHR